MVQSLFPIEPDAPWLAPLAGWSDLPFRMLCRELGAAVCCTEMVSAKGIVYERKSGGRATHGLLDSLSADAPLVVQLFGDDPAFMGEAVRMLIDDGHVFFDCNMGCSVPKVTKSGSGAALLKEVDRALGVARSMLEPALRNGAHVGFKLRLGWETGNEDGLELGRMLSGEGAAWITLHPRSARQGFSGRADWEKIARLVSVLDIPVVASGDLMTAQDGVRCLRETGARAAMYARGALRDPAVFARHRALWSGETVQDAGHESAGILHARILRHAVLARSLSSPHQALLKMRTAVPRYVKHLEGARALRQAIISCRSWVDFDQVLASYFQDRARWVDEAPDKGE